MSIENLYPKYAGKVVKKRRDLAPEIMAAWQNFSKQVFTPGALDLKTKQMIAVAVAHVTQCPYCIRGHVKEAMQAGVTEEELMEAIWIAAAGRASGAYTHAGIARDQMDIEEGLPGDGHLFPESGPEMAAKKAKLAPEIVDTWRKFSNTVFKKNILDEKTKQLIALAISHVTQCAYCIRGHVKSAKAKGATEEQMMEAIWVAAEMRAGAAYAHSIIACDQMMEEE